MSENRHDLEKQDDDISNILQKFGKYQIVQYFLICLPIVFIFMNNVNYVFVAGDIDYRCRLPECESLDNTYSISWWSSKMNRCKKPDLNYTNLKEGQCTNDTFTSSVSDCTTWIYGSKDTIVEWLDLACRPWETNFVGTIHSLGMVSGIMIGGWCTDRFGRKPTLIVASVGIVVGTIKTLMKSYYAYIFIELIEATLSGGVFAAGMILIMEISGNDKRVLAGVLFSYAVYTGEALLAGIAYLVTYWKTIIYLSCMPPILFLLYINLLIESPRWHVLNDQLKEARNTLKIIVKLNKLNICPESIDNIDKLKLQQVCNVEVTTKKEGFLDIFLSMEIIKRLVVAIVARFSASLIYYGLVAYSVWLSGNKYTNYVIGAVISFPGDILALYVMDKIGRKWPLIYGYLITGVACIAYAFVPESLLWLKLLIFLIAKLIIAACFTGVLTYTVELFPTSVRGSLLGLCTFVASAGAMLAPLTPVMDTISPVFASFLFGFAAFLTCLALTLTPETKDVPLVGTIEEAVNRVAASKKIKKEQTKEVHKLEADSSDFISIHL